MQNPDMEKFIVVKVSELHEAKWNYKKDDDTDKIDKLAENMKRNGQVENLMVRKIRKGYEVINGNHRLKALRKNKTEKAIVYNFGKMKIKDAKRIAIETNETKFERDDIKFGQLLEEISVEHSLEDLAATLPFSQDQIKQIIDSANVNFDEFFEETEISTKTKKPKIITCPHCGKEFTEE